MNPRDCSQGKIGSWRIPGAVPGAGSEAESSQEGARGSAGGGETPQGEDSPGRPCPGFFFLVFSRQNAGAGAPGAAQRHPHQLQHEAADGAGEGIPLQQIPDAGPPRGDRGHAGAQRGAGEDLVPEPQDEAEEEGEGRAGPRQGGQSSGGNLGSILARNLPEPRLLLNPPRGCGSGPGSS